MALVVSFEQVQAARALRLAAVLLGEPAGVRQGLLQTWEALRELRCQPVRNLLKGDFPVHQFERSATQAPLLGKVRDVVCRYSVELDNRQHFPGQLGLLKMEDWSTRSSEWFNPCSPSPNVIVFHQF